MEHWKRRWDKGRKDGIEEEKMGQRKRRRDKGREDGLDEEKME